MMKNAGVKEISNTPADRGATSDKLGD